MTDDREDVIARLDRDGPGHWILGEDGEPQRVGVMTWAVWLETHDRERMVRRDTVRHGIDVSTVFLGFDAAFMGGPPILWETMILGGPFDGFQRRYTSKLAALEGHAGAARLVWVYFAAPRKTKKALAKYAADRAVRPVRELGRLAAALRRVWPTLA